MTEDCTECEFVTLKQWNDVDLRSRDGFVPMDDHACFVKPCREHADGKHAGGGFKQ